MPEQNFHIGYIGLGKMGSNMVERLCEMGHMVSAYDPAQAARDRLANIDNATAYDNYQAMIETLPAKNRIICEMTIKDGEILWDLNGRSRDDWEATPIPYQLH